MGERARTLVWWRMQITTERTRKWICMRGDDLMFSSADCIIYVSWFLFRFRPFNMNERKKYGSRKLKHIINLDSGCKHFEAETKNGKEHFSNNSQYKQRYIYGCHNNVVNILYAFNIAIQLDICWQLYMPPSLRRAVWNGNSQLWTPPTSPAMRFVSFVVLRKVCDIITIWRRLMSFLFGASTIYIISNNKIINSRLMLTMTIPLLPLTKHYTFVVWQNVLICFWILRWCIIHYFGTSWRLWRNNFSSSHYH